VLLVLVLLAAFALPGCGSPAGGVVTVLGPWTGAEERGFLKMLKGFENTYGIQFNYTGTRDADAVLASDLQNGHPPDLAVLATRGELRQFAAAGTARPIDGALDLARMARQYSFGWQQFMHAAGPSGKPHYYAIIVKATLKSVIWYDPKKFPGRDLGLLTSPDLTWSQLISLTNSLTARGTSPWCMGMADVSRSGWPGTDWIEDIVLHQSGWQVYDQWAQGDLPWTSAPITRAWQTFGQIAAAPGAVAGGTESELTAGYGQAGQPMFTNPTRCYLDHEGSFVIGFYPQDTLSGSGRSAHPRPDTDFKFIPFPPLTPASPDVEEVSADLLAMFHDTPAARKLINYLTLPQAQEKWIKLPDSGALSVNGQVPLNMYPDKVSSALAKILIHATRIRFDASNSMPQTMENAFDNAVLQYLDCPAQLNVILNGLDLVRKNYPPASQRIGTAGQFHATGSPRPRHAISAPASSCVTRSKTTRPRYKRSPR
jgi:alpha-glucoside transport system substrate-binding protein